MAQKSNAVLNLMIQSPDDIVITFAKRSASGKARRGQYKDMRADELLISFLKSAIPELGIDLALIGDICVGTVLPPGPGYLARSCALAAGFPVSVAVNTVNRFCSSGLMAVANIANSIRNEEMEIGFAVGFESMSAIPDDGASGFCQEIMDHPIARDCAQSMGWTSEQVAEEFNISRESQDNLAAQSHQRAFAAQKAGKFDEEILPIFALQATTSNTDSTRVKVLVTADDGIRGDSTKESLAKIRPAFKDWGNSTTTGGNASQITDGVAGVLMMTRRKAEELGLEILAKHICTSVAGLAPRIMGIGPSFAIPKVLARAGIVKEDVDLWEINEAFSSMLVYMIDHFGLPHEKVNVNGGAIALGHPLGCTGARQVATGIAEGRKLGGAILVTSMCVGLGQSGAAVFVVEPPNIH